MICDLPRDSAIQIKPIYSVRISLGWRAIGIRKEDTMIWYWIGSHYDNLISPR
ncbi:MAG: hypothetical protein ACRD18_01885 [Terriglobia bacterium]